MSFDAVSSRFEREATGSHEHDALMSHKSPHKPGWLNGRSDLSLSLPLSHRTGWYTLL